MEGTIAECKLGAAAERPLRRGKGMLAESDRGGACDAQEVIVANTIPVPEESQFPCLTVLSVANLLGVLPPPPPTHVDTVTT